MKNLGLTIFCIAVFLINAAFAQESTYTDDKLGFSITYPSGYRVLKNYQKNVPLLIFLPSRTMIFNDYIAINITNVRLLSRPIEELIDINFKYDKTVLEKKDMVINGIKFITVTQTQTQKILFFNLKLKLYHIICFKGAKIYTITYTATAETFDKNLDQAKKIMYSFRNVS